VPPYNINWDTTTGVNGRINGQPLAADSPGNQATSAVVNVTARMQCRARFGSRTHCLAARRRARTGDADVG